MPDAATRGVVVGRDGRRMSAEFAEDAASVLAAEGIPAHVFPALAPTPLAAFATLHLNAAAGVMVTASHNPPEYNGYKVYWGNGAQIIPPHDKGIAAAIAAVEPANQVRLLTPADARARGPLERSARRRGRRLPRRHPRAARARAGLGLADDRLHAMHGVGGRVDGAALMERAGFRHFHPVAEQQQPDGAFPTVRFPNPEEPGAMDLSLAAARAREARTWCSPTIRTRTGSR